MKTLALSFLGILALSGTGLAQRDMLPEKGIAAYMGKVERGESGVNPRDQNAARAVDPEAAARVRMESERPRRQTEERPRAEASAGPVFASVGWVTQVSGVSGFLSGVSCVDVATAWACGQNGTILRTTNGGKSWQKLKTALPADEEVTDVEFVSRTTGWAIGAANAILRTTNGGTSWSSQSWLGSIYPPILLDVSAVDATHAWIGGYETSNWMNYSTYNSVLLGTRDGARWWSPGGVAAGEYGHGFVGVDFVDLSHGWAVADNAICMSSDGGATWTELLYFNVGSSFDDVSFADARNGWVVGEESSSNGFVMHTSDGGRTWYRQAEDQIASGAVGCVNGVCAVSPTTAWAVCEGGYVLHTTDAGATWTVERPTTKDLNEISFINAETGWAVGDGGVILRHGPPPVIDTGKPTGLALWNVGVIKGRKATLSYKIRDPLPSCGSAKATITIKRGPKIVKTIRLTGVPTNKIRRYTFRVNLPRGVYTWTVKATDIAGNVGKASAAKRLTVR